MDNGPLIGSRLKAIPDFSDFPNVIEHPDHYAKAFTVYEDKANLPQMCIEWIRQKFQDEVVKRLPDLTSSSSTATGLRVLGVGSGNGDIEVHFILQLLKRFPKIEATVVEPSEARLGKYRKMVEERSDEFQGVTWIWRQERMEDFLQSTTSDAESHFDFISMVHFLYFIHISRLEKELVKYHRLLTDTGMLLIMQLHESKNIKLLQDFFPRPLSLFKPSTNDEHVLTAMQKIGIPARRMDVLHSSVNITDCFDRSNVDGGHLLDFILNIDQCRLIIPPDQLQITLNLLKAGCSLSGVESYFSYPQAVILSSK